MGQLEPLEEIRAICQGARILTEPGQRYVDLPGLSFVSAENSIVRDALLSLDAHSGYTTRLFLSEIVDGKGANWTPFVILGRTWYTWSWNNVPATLRPAQILAEHLRGLR